METRPRKAGFNHDSSIAASLWESPITSMPQVHKLGELVNDVPEHLPREKIL
jgi:hypothetical protein